MSAQADNKEDEHNSQKKPRRSDDTLRRSFNSRRAHTLPSSDNSEKSEVNYTSVNGETNGNFGKGQY